MEIHFSSYEYIDLINYSHKRLSDLEYTNDVAPLREQPVKCETLSNHLNDYVGLLLMCFDLRKVAFQY